MRRCAHLAVGLESAAVPVSLTREDIDYIREGYRLFRERDPAFLERYAPDATLVFPETLPKGGIYRSPWDALEFWNTIGELFEDPHPEPEEFIRDGDRLVVLGTWHAVIPSSGRRVSARVVHVIRYSGGDVPLSEQKIIGFELIADTATFAAALAEADSG
jgi:ketosteroid isomerase-like protein